MESIRSLWIGDVQPNYTEDMLFPIFQSACGPGELIGIKLMRDKMTGLPSGYGFAEFVTQDVAARVLAAINGRPIEASGRTLRLNWGGGRRPPLAAAGSAPSAPATGLPSIAETSLFVGDLPFDVNDAMLTGLFQARYPTCTGAKVVHDPATGMSKGYGFVRFTNQGDRDRAIAEMNGQMCGSRPMRVSLATPKRQDGGGMGGGGSMMHSGMGGGMGGGMMAPAYSHAPHPSAYGGYGGGGYPSGPSGYPGGPSAAVPAAPMHASVGAIPQPGVNTTVFVGGVGPEVTEGMLRAAFEPLGPVYTVKIPVGKNCAFVQYITPQPAEIAIATLNGHTVGSSRLRLAWGKTPNPGIPSGGPAPGGAPGAGYYGSPYPDPYASYYQGGWGMYGGVGPTGSSGGASPSGRGGGGGRYPAPGSYGGPEDGYDASGASAEYAARAMDKYDAPPQVPHMKMHMEPLEKSGVM